MEKSFFLQSSEREKLYKCIERSNVSLADVERTFKETFKTSDFDAVTNELASLSKELIVSAEGIPFISSLYIIHVMMKMGYTGAKCAFYSMLVQLERALKKDIYDAKEKTFLSKESEENKKSVEAVRSEIYRIHSCAKVFAFNLLNDTISPEKTLLDIISQKQEIIDSQIDKFEQGSGLLQSTISEAFESWKLDSESNNCSSLMESCALFGKTRKRYASISLPTVKPKLPSAPVVPGELQFFLPNADEKCIVFDSMV